MAIDLEWCAIFNVEKIRCCPRIGTNNWKNQLNWWPFRNRIIVKRITSGGQKNEAVNIKFSFPWRGQNTKEVHLWRERCLPWAYVEKPSEGTMSLALPVEDPDAPGGVFTHWILFNVPAGIMMLPQGMPTQSQLPDGSLQGKNDFLSSRYLFNCDQLWMQSVWHRHIIGTKP